MNLENQPINKVYWINRKDLVPNHYNPNNVAPPELELLEFSIKKLGWVFPVLANPAHAYKCQKKFGVITIKTEAPLPIIDGFHRYTVSGFDSIMKMTGGYLPLVLIEPENAEMITVMMNRAKGHHNVVDMAQIIVTLIGRGVTMGEIMQGMGMDQEEVLRLATSKGIPASTLINGKEFNKAWITEDK